MFKQGQKLPPTGGNMQGFLWTPCNATSRTTGQDALWHHILDRNRSSQPFMTPCARQFMNRIPGNVTPSWAGCPSHAQWAEQYTYQHRETDNQQGRPPRPRPHCTQARWPHVPCCISPHHGIISTLKILAVSSGATWTLSLRNFLCTCITVTGYFESLKEFWTIFMHRFSYKVFECAKIARCQHCNADNFITL